MAVEFIIPSSDFSFHSHEKTLHGFSESFGGGFPAEFKVVSVHTGKVVTFKHISENHPQFDHDFWDGEQAVYEPVEPQRNVKLCILIHAY